jgi:Helix-turn-helix domain
MISQAPSLRLLQVQTPPVLDPRRRYTVPQAIVLLCTSRASLYKLIKAGKLHPIKQGRRTFIAGSEIADLSAVPANAA